MIDLAALKSQFPIEGEQLSLRLFNRDDITDSYVSWLNDPQVVKYSNQRFRTHTIASCEDYFNTFEQACALFIAIEHKQHNEMIGTMTVYINPHHATADIGVLLGNTHYWGQGLGHQCWQLMLNQLLASPQLRKITAGTLSCNHSMRQLMIKSGMVADGIRKAQEVVEGQACDILYYARFNPDYKQA